MVRSWDVAGDLPPIDARTLLTAERTELVRFLGALDGDAWQAPTACPGWSIHDVALHLVVRRTAGGSWPTHRDRSPLRWWCPPTSPGAC